MRLCFAFLFALLPQGAAAGGCDGADTTVAMGLCLQQGLEAADADLNLSYQMAMVNINDSGFEQPDALAGQLRAAQRAWITYRDLACDAEMALYEGGSMAGLAKTGCLLRLTEERVASLAEFLPN